MPLPFILGIGAAIAGLAGLGAGVSGAVDMSDAKQTIKYAQEDHEENVRRYKSTEKKANTSMDKLGKYEMEIMKDFEEFSDTIEKIQNRPVFKEYERNGVKIPEYNPRTIKEVSIGARVVLTSLSGATLGTAGGFAASGATTAAVMALGHASTGTAIAGLHGAAATNATLAALGGGSLAAGGGGVALGSAVLGAASLGVGLLIGGFIFKSSGDKMWEKADEICDQVEAAKKKIDAACEILNDIDNCSNRYYRSLKNVKNKYDKYFMTLSETVNDNHRTNWNNFTCEEKKATEACVLLVGLLYKMCKVNLLIEPQSKDDVVKVNSTVVNKSCNDAKTIVSNI